MALKVDIKKSMESFDLDVSFTVPAGMLTALVGPSGAGKTTIIRMIAGLEKPDEGFIAYNDEIWFDSIRKIFLGTQKRFVGFVFQDYPLFPHLSVYGNVSFAAKKKENAEWFMNLFRIRQLRDSKPHMISGGERQRCAICQNLVREPKILLMDEPFSALDVENRRRLRKEMSVLKEKLNIPIIHVTHDLEEALYLGDEVLTIVKGKKDPKWLEQQIRNGWTEATKLYIQRPGGIQRSPKAYTDSHHLYTDSMQS
jgi:molybdate transport system ATP-binding protein